MQFFAGITKFGEDSNTLTVEFHQVTQFSSKDMIFDCELTAIPVAAATCLTTMLRGSLLELTWPAWTDRLSHQSTASLAPPLQWAVVTNVAQAIAGQWTVRVAVETIGQRFFRLHAQLKALPGKAD